MSRSNDRQPTIEISPKDAQRRQPDVVGSLGVKTRPEAAEIFLAPRVVDQQAFEDYAQRLRSLIDQTSDSADAVRASLDEIRSLKSETADALTRQKTVLEAGSKLVKAMDAKRAQLDASRLDARQTEERLEKVTARAHEVSSSLEERLEAVIEDRIARVERTIDERLHTLTSSIEAKLNERVEAMSATLSAIDAKRDELQTLVQDATENTLRALKDTQENASRLAGWDPADIVDGVGVGQPARDSLADLMLRAQGMQGDTERAIERLSALRDASSAVTNDMARALDATREEILRLDADRRSLEERLSEAGQETARLHETTAPLLDLQQRAAQATSDLAALLVQGRTARDEGVSTHEDLRRAIDHAREALLALGPWQDVCFASIEDAERVALPPVLQAITERFRDGFARDMTDMASAVRSIAQRSAEDFRRQ